MLSRRQNSDITHLGRLALAFGRAAQVVDNDACSTRSEEGGIDLAEAAASSSDDDDLAVISQLLSHDDVDV
jgi:hypothetical protein